MDCEAIGAIGQCLGRPQYSLRWAISRYKYDISVGRPVAQAVSQGSNAV